MPVAYARVLCSHGHQKRDRSTRMHQSCCHTSFAVSFLFFFLLRRPLSWSTGVLASLSTGVLPVFASNSLLSQNLHGPLGRAGCPFHAALGPEFSAFTLLLLCCLSLRNTLLLCVGDSLHTYMYYSIVNAAMKTVTVVFNPWAKSSLPLVSVPYV